MISFIKCNCGY